MAEYRFNPIGVLHCDAVYTQETPRQGAFSRRTAVIELDRQYKNALQDLDGVSHIWIIWVFDRAKNWKSIVHPPTADRGIGVFATRSPHRPNPIGITAARLVKVEDTRLTVENIDLLDNTPILDIKPYIPDADSFPEAQVKWQNENPFEIKEFSFSETAAEKALFIKEHGNIDILETARVQLATRKLDPERQRLVLEENGGVLAFRTWRIHFSYDDSGINVTDIASGYTQKELSPESIDKYGDHELHRKFLQKFFALSSK